MPLIKNPILSLWISFIFFGLLIVGAPAQAGECPAATSLTKLAEGASFQKKGPFAAKTVTKATATQTKKGLVVFLSNKDIDAKKAASDLPLPPVTGKGNIAVTLTFMNDGKLVVGNYQPKSLGDPMNLKTSIFFGFANGGMMSSFSGRQGKAQITELSDTKVCGNFEVTGTGGSVAGQFTAPIVK